MSPRSLLDLDHLAEQTCGDTALERDLLTLFDRQCVDLGPRIVEADNGDARAEAAHTLRGGAAGIGASRIAELTGLIEEGWRDGRGAPPPGVLDELALAIEETRGALARRAAALG